MSSIMGLPADNLLKPAGYDAPITDHCCAERCKAFLDLFYLWGCKDTADRMLEIIGKLHQEHLGVPDMPNDYEHACKDIMRAIEDLKGGAGSEK